MFTTLESAFFAQEDQKLIEKQQMLRKLKETKETLSKISGITNDAVLQKLVDLDIRPETLTSMCLAPLVAIAWADGIVDNKEKEAILTSVDKLGFKQGSDNYDILTQWLTHKPSSDLLTAWIHYIEGMCEKLEPDEIQELKSSIMEHAGNIAKASGGFLNLGIGNTVSQQEQEILNKLEQAFSKTCK
jgi:hypothetical protein